VWSQPGLRVLFVETTCVSTSCVLGEWTYSLFGASVRRLHAGVMFRRLLRAISMTFKSNGIQAVIALFPGRANRAKAGKGCPGHGVLPCNTRRRDGFSLVEALVAIAIMAIAGSALLWGVMGTMQTTDDSVQQALAIGMAQQLMDEVLGARYHAVGSDGYETSMSASSWEKSGEGRERYNDIDDFNGLRFEPPMEVYGTAVGTGDDTGDLRHPSFRVGQDYFQNWRQEIDVFYVDPDDFSRNLSTGSVSDYRAVEIRIVREDPDSDPRVLAELRQVVSYIPPL